MNLTEFQKKALAICETIEDVQRIVGPLVTADKPYTDPAGIGWGEAAAHPISKVKKQSLCGDQKQFPIWPHSWVG